MSISGIGSSNVPRTPAPLPNQVPVRDGGRTNVQRPATPATARPDPRTALAPGRAPAQGTVPAEAPPGTDPALWSVLSGEERAFFAKAGAMGPLTYGRAWQDTQAPQNPASRGGRLDVKV